MLEECPHCSTRVLPMAGRICPACRRSLDAPPDPEPPSRQAVEEAYGYAAGRMLQGEEPSAIAQGLAGRGLDPEAATAVVRHIDQVRSDSKRRTGQRNMIFGALWCFGGVALTTASFLFAGNTGGGRVVIAWGAILFGGIQFVRGIIQSSTVEAP